MKNPLTTLARNLRKNMTDAEQKLWYCLNNKQLKNLKFRRQTPIGKYIVDFLCYERRLVIELDGGQHAEKKNSKKDLIRDQWLISQGYHVMRFWNVDVLENIDGVIDSILRAVE